MNEKPDTKMLRVILATTFFVVCAKSPHYIGAWAFPYAVVLCILPFTFFWLYRAMLSKQIFLSKLNSDGVIFRFSSSRVISSIVSVTAAVIFCCYSIAKVSSYDHVHIAILYAATIAYLFLQRIISKKIGTEFQQKYANHYTIIVSFAAVSLASLCMIYVTEYRDISVASYQSLAQAIYMQHEQYAPLASSGIASTITSYIEFSDGCKAYGLSLLRGEYFALGLLFAVGESAIFLTLLSIVSCFMLSSADFTGIFIPAKNEERTKSNQTFGRIVVTVLVICAMYFPAYYYIDSVVSNNAEVYKLERPKHLFVEMIDGKRYTEGAEQKISAVISAHRLDGERAVGRFIDHGIDRICDEMVDKVDGYLDGYYTLTAEYMRLIYFITGSGAEYFASDFSKFIGAESLTRHMEDAGKMSDTYLNAQYPKALSEVESVLAQHIVIDDGKTAYTVRKQNSLSTILKPLSDFRDTITFRNRALVSGLTGVVAGTSVGVIAYKVANRVVGKPIFVAFAKAISKLAFRLGVKTALPAAGAAIGAILPLPGTTYVGVTIGVMAGTAAGLGVDKLILEFNEWCDREELKRTLVQAIDDFRYETKRSFRL